MAADATPVPLSVIFCGLVFALSVIVTIPVRDPAAVGVNVIEIVQLPRAATELPQVLVWAKSPVMVMLPTLKTTDEPLLTVTDFAALVIPTATVPNERELLERLASGPALDAPP
jgi:hypothetical protein